MNCNASLAQYATNQECLPHTGFDWLIPMGLLGLLLLLLGLWIYNHNQEK